MATKPSGSRRRREDEQHLQPGRHPGEARAEPALVLAVHVIRCCVRALRSRRLGATPRACPDSRASPADRAFRAECPRSPPAGRRRARRGRPRGSSRASSSASGLRHVSAAKRCSALRRRSLSSLEAQDLIPLAAAPRPLLSCNDCRPQARAVRRVRRTAPRGHKGPQSHVETKKSADGSNVSSGSRQGLSCPRAALRARLGRACKARGRASQ